MNLKPLLSLVLLLIMLMGCAQATATPAAIGPEVFAAADPVDGIWQGTLTETTGDLRIFKAEMELVRVAGTNTITGELVYRLDEDPSYEEIHVLEGNMEGEAIKFTTDKGQYYTAVIAGSSLTADVSFECYQCAVWGRLELIRADSIAVAETEEPVAVIATNPANPGESQNAEASPLISYQLLEGHKSAVRVLDWSPDGSKIVTGGEDQAIVIWDSHGTGELDRLPLGGHDGVAATVLSWKPDSNAIALGYADGVIQIWDLVNHQVNMMTVSTVPNPVSCLEWHPAGTEVAVCSPSYYEPGLSFFFDQNTGQKTYGLSTDSGMIKWSPDGRFYADLSPFGLDMRQSSSALVWSALPDFGLANTLAWSSDGSLVLASTAQSGKVIIFDAATGAELMTLEEYFSDQGYPPADLQWRPGTNTIVALDGDGNLIVWDANSGGVIGIYPTGLSFTYLRWSPDGRYLVPFGGFSDASGRMINIPIWKVE